MNAPSNSVSVAKANRVRFGVTGQPIQASRAFRKDMPFDHEGTATQSWILVTPAGLLRANSYNGGLGKNFDPNAVGVIHPVPANERDFARKVKGYTEVNVDQCPFATAAPAAPVTEEVPA